MKRQILLVAGVLLLFRCTGTAMELKFDNIKIGSVTYTNVVITGINPADIYFHHNGGMANVKLRQLDPTIQKKLNFDADRAAEAERQQVEDNERYNQAALRDFATRVVQEREANDNATNAEPPFALADPLSDHSPLNRPAPKLDIKKWFGEPPPPLAGRFALIFFWNSTSLPCQPAIKALNDLSKRYTDSLTVIALTTEAADQLKPQDTPLECFSGSEPTGKYANALGVESVPSVVLLDTKGVVRFAGHPAAFSEEALQKIMARYPVE